MYKTSNGFTLLELLIAALIASILLTVALPCLGYFKHSSERSAITSDIRRSLAYSRENAITRNTYTTICGLNESGECSRNNIQSLAVFVDKDKDGLLTEKDETLAIRELNHSGNLTLRASLRKSSITFDRHGAALAAGSFIYCKPDFPEFAARITVSMTGRSYVAKKNSNGVVRNTNGSAINCE